MTAPVVGFSVVREANEPQPPSYARMSGIGLIGPADPATGVQQADFDAKFPLGEIVNFNSTDATARMIDPDGYIGDALAGINSQTGRLQRSARVNFIRVAEGADTQETTTNIITALPKFKTAGAEVGMYSRLIAAPGYTSWQADSNTANPIAAALPGVLNSFLGVAVIDAPGVDQQGDIDYRETNSSERVMVATPGVYTRDSGGSQVSRPMSSRILGLFVRRDHEHEGRPFRSVLNQPVYGVEGPTRAIDFSLTDGATDGQDLLSHQIGPLIRGESGDDFAIADGGFVFMGFEGTGADAVWQQIHKVRGRDFIELTAIRTLRNLLGKFNLNNQTIQTVVNTLVGILSSAEAKQEILGFNCRFDPEQNNEADLRTGHIYVDTRFEEAAVFRKATLLSRPYEPALTTTIEQLLARVDELGI